ncbi:MAG: SPOR domain-containing protein [Oscillospiraceae bacterium]|nr:SPOR domain-containing protein [Oscillospiraceae bacterium]
MNLIECLMRQSTCYKNTTKGIPVGVLWHDAGSGNANLRRYVQPDDNDPNRAALLKLIGKNQYNNDLNHISAQRGVNAFVGKLADGSVATAKTLPDNFRPWGCGSGPKGSCNGSPYADNGPFWLQFEILDDAWNNNVRDYTAGSEEYFRAAYREAVELTAYWCDLYGIDPFGVVEYKDPKIKKIVKVPTILCHKDAHDLGLGSDHKDVLMWMGRYGVTMDKVRTDVKAAMKKPDTIYRVQVGAFRNRAYADAYLEKVRKTYPESFIVEAHK